MEWRDTIYNRHQTFIFEETVPDKLLIDKICEEMHARCPSKQNRVKYQMHVLDWSNHQLRMDLYATTDRSPVNEQWSHYNPQVLAPYLFVWSDRDLDTIVLPQDGKTDINIEYQNPEWARQSNMLEIGLSSMFVALSAADKGLQSGFCKCIKNAEIIDDKYGFWPLLMLGVGYEKPDAPYYYCPILKREVQTPSDSWNPKPEVDQYIHYSV